MNIPYVMKKCSKCGRWLVASTVNFHKNKHCKYGLREICKECSNKKYRARNNPANTELGVKFKPGFTGQILQLGDGEHIFRVDIIVKSASICELNTLNELFGWTGNDCLYSSVKNALQDMNPVGRPIYSYFIRLQ